MNLSKRINQYVIDAILIIASVVSSYLIYFNWDLGNPFLDQLVFMIPLVIAGRLITNSLLGVYKQIWRYITFPDILKLTETTIFFSLLLVFINLLSHNIDAAFNIPYGIITIEFMYTLIGLTAIRVGRRLIFEHQDIKKRTISDHHVKETILIGAGEAGQQVLHETIHKPQLGIKVIGFLDDDERKQGTVINKVPIVGKITDITEIASYKKIDQLIICIPSASEEELRSITSKASKSKIPTKIVPGFSELIDGKVQIEQLREVNITDLLRRDPVKLHFESLKYIHQARVLVTGAGGSIGSELCRQIARFNPKEIVLLGKGEYSIYLIYEELKEKYPDLLIYPVIADVKNKFRIEYIFKKFKPDVVFHAAAHKHVPLMELQPSEAILNNVMGTRNVAELAHQYHANTFVLISTDKAVNPTNIMGSTKRVAELIIQDLAKSSTTTRYVAVRFGNVLGSRGSVIPKFKKQIAKGGPVTITNPEMTRYFMTIPEAAQLVIQAGSLGNGGEIFILDMGKPVKIYDLAKDLITLSGMVPGKDIEIKITGLRPGEKIYEELLTAEEGINATCHDKIFVAPITSVDSGFLENQVDKLEKSAIANNDEEIRKILENDLNILKPLKTQTPVSKKEEIN
ncbi:MAG: nucleoside-diphosphate sugar epimerase/dehydratase [Cyanobacteriota bacterium]